LLDLAAAQPAHHDERRAPIGSHLRDHLRGSAVGDVDSLRRQLVLGGELGHRASL